MTEIVTNKDVKPIRKAMGMTQQQFATYLEVTVKAVSLWETREDMKIHPGNLSKLRKLKKKYVAN